jgi:UDP-glucose 4-epimerase
MIHNKRIFITGGAGFVGSLLARTLVQHNQVCIYDNFLRDALKFRESDHNHNLQIIQGDILDYENLSRSIAEFAPTHIVHCAAIAGIDSVVKSPTTTLRVNIIGSANLLNAIHSSNLPYERVVLFSTSEIFGSHAFQSTESHSAVIGAVGEARWTYAVSKLADEHFGLAYFKEFNMPCTVVRPFNVYGPGQVGEGALSTFVQRAIKDEPISIHGDGNQIRSWCYVDDMLAGLMLVLSEKAAVGESFNIGNPRSVVTTYGLAQTVCRVLNSKSSISFSGRYFADIELRIPDIKKAKKLLNFIPKMDLEEGIFNTAEFYRNVM